MNTYRYFKFFQDLWRFFKDHADPVSADSWWARLAEDGVALADRYGNTEFVKKMITAVVWEIDRAYQEKINASNNL